MQSVRLRACSSTALIDSPKPTLSSSSVNVTQLFRRSGRTVDSRPLAETDSFIKSVNSAWFERSILQLSHLFVLRTVVVTLCHESKLGFARCTGSPSTSSDKTVDIFIEKAAN